MTYPVENALFQWEEGAREMQAVEDPRERRRVDRVVGAVQDELRRRIGPTFSTAQLADLYGAGTDWALRITTDTEPTLAVDARAICDAAFYLYLRGAVDFAGGRQLIS